MKVVVLGSGTSTGIPVIGCSCPVCTSTDPRNKRLRSSIKVEAGGQTIVIDCGVDFRQQMLAHPTPRIDAVLLTHTHADHIHGLDDLRAFVFRQKMHIPIYSTKAFLEDIRTRFAYAFDPFQMGGGIPKFELREIEPGGSFEVNGLRIVPVGIMHGKLPILGYRFGPFAYLTDCSGIPEESHKLLEGVKTLIISALRTKEHPTHFNIAQSLVAAQKIGADRAYFIHMCDAVDHAETEARLPPHVRLTYDGMILET
ncbi:MBL fold metallo-hydrolase [Candidatus Sumerlaeota bacterium]|nr:MBL fold metallo-hydrolase [Candidatus Sumerlaeota bacterium]